MPKITKRTSQGRGTFNCAKCRKPITKGQSYFEWGIKTGRGGTLLRQHEDPCGPPRQSQLTQSKMSGAYAAVEAAEDAVKAAGDVDDLRTALDDCAQAIEEVRDEYQESLDAMPEGLQQGPTGEDIQNKIDELESFKDELESASSDLQDFDEEEPTGDVDEDSDAFKAWDEQEPDRGGSKTEHDAWLADKPTAESVHAAWAEALEAHLEE